MGLVWCFSITSVSLNVLVISANLSQAAAMLSVDSFAARQPRLIFRDQKQTNNACLFVVCSLQCAASNRSKKA
jgi:hypothetical protein